MRFCSLLPLISGNRQDKAGRQVWSEKTGRAMSDPKQSQSMMRYAGLATQWMVMLGLAAYGGLKLDHFIQEKFPNWKFPLFLILFPLIALGLSMWQLIKELNRKGK